MAETPSHSPRWSPIEMKMINVVDLFQHKPGIMKKAEEYLIGLKETLIRELADHPLPMPPNTDVVKGQLVRGENHLGFPFRSLDLPQMFTKTEYFTYRVLFWWGHYLGCSLILKGPDLPRYTDNLVRQRKSMDTQSVLMSCDPNPWEWRETSFQPLTQYSDERIAELANQHQYMKLIRVYPVRHGGFEYLDWTHVGMDTFRMLVRLVLDRT